MLSIGIGGRNQPEYAIVFDGADSWIAPLLKPHVLAYIVGRTRFDSGAVGRFTHPAEGLPQGDGPGGAPVDIEKAKRYHCN